MCPAWTGCLVGWLAWPALYAWTTPPAAAPYLDLACACLAEQRPNAHLPQRTWTSTPKAATTRAPRPTNERRMGLNSLWTGLGGIDSRHNGTLYTNPVASVRARIETYPHQKRARNRRVLLRLQSRSMLLLCLSFCFYMCALIWFGRDLSRLRCFGLTCASVRTASRSVSALAFGCGSA